MLGDDDRDKGCAHAIGQRSQQYVLADERVLVAEQNAAAAHGDHVVVKHPGVDCFWMLLCEQRSLRRETVAPRDRFGCFARLPGRKAARRRCSRIERHAPVDEQLDAGGVAGCREPRVIGCAFVTELLRRRQRFVHGEAPLIGEDRAQHARRGRGLQRTMEMRDQIGGSEVHAAVGGVDGRTDCSGVGNPHRRRRRTRGEERRRFTRGNR